MKLVARQVQGMVFQVQGHKNLSSFQDQALYDEHLCNFVCRRQESFHAMRSLLHFAWVVDHEKCIVVTRVCVSVCPRPHAYTIARTRM